MRDLEVLDTPGRPARDRDLQGRLDGRRERPLRGQGRQRDPPARGVQRLGLTQPTPWEPDIFKEGGFANLQKNPILACNVDASLTGNFFDTTFDGQSAIIGRKRKAIPGPLGADNAWIGQNPDTGFLAIAPVDRARPGHRRPVADARRSAAQRLAADGAKLLDRARRARTRSPSARARNGYRESVVWAT